MTDLLKLLSTEMDFIQKMYEHPLLERYSYNQKNNKHFFIHPNEFNQATLIKHYNNILFCFYIRKNSGEESIFTKLEILIKPHYYFNNNLHNANDFSALNSIKVLLKIKELFNFSDTKLKVINIEIGFNFLPHLPYEDFISLIIYHQKNQFLTDKELPFSKISFKFNSNGKANKYKRIKFYGKGVQYPSHTNINTFRFEINSKVSKYINSLGVYNYADLLEISTYKRFAEELKKEFNKVLIIDINNDMQNLSEEEKVILIKFLNPITFDRAINGSKNLFNNYKKKYNLLLDKTGNNIHTVLKNIIKDKLSDLLPCADSTPLEDDKMCADSSINIIQIGTSKLCQVTGFDISMQKSNSIMLNVTGLRYYYENNKNIYKKLKQKHLKKRWWNSSLELQFYHLAHNIRDVKRNREVKLKKLYSPNQPLLFNIPQQDYKYSI